MDYWFSTTENQLAMSDITRLFPMQGVSFSAS